jgi:hypothetical protein
MFVRPVMHLRFQTSWPSVALLPKHCIETNNNQNTGREWERNEDGTVVTEATSLNFERRSDRPTLMYRRPKFSILFFFFPCRS